MLVNACVAAALHFGAYQFYYYMYNTFSEPSCLDCLIVFGFIKSEIVIIGSAEVFFLFLTLMGKD